MHVIQQQNLQLSFHGEMKAEALSVQLSRWLNERLLPAMDVVLNEMDSSKGRLRIERVELDAGLIESEDWESVLTERVCRELRQQLRQAPLLPLGDEEQSLLYYLRHGRLPWHASMDVSQLMQRWKGAIADGFFNGDKTLRFFKEDNAAFQRFLRQTPPALLEQWSNAWLTQTQKVFLPNVLLLAKKTFGTSHTALEWSYALLFDGNETSTQPLWKNYLQNDAATKDFEVYTKQFLHEELSLKDWKEKLSQTGLKPVDETIVANDQTGEMYFIANAGLVLLHPFLKNFFTAVHFLNENGDWLNEAAQRRAVLLLHFLCTGKTEAADYDLPLCKLLTGFPVTQPAEVLIELTDEERREAYALLESVIEQWSVLKTTSVEGLRQSFLQREGKLKKTGNGWLLQVEQKSYDVLLSHLPWSIGVIKTPWMKELLFTEWA